MDIYLLLIAIVLLLFVRTKELLLLVVSFGISSFAVSEDLINALGSYWYVAYAGWLGIFCVLSRNKLIVFGYITVLVFILCAYIEFATGRMIVHTIYPYVIGGIYLMQLAATTYVEFNRSDASSTHRYNHDHINLALMEPGS